MRSARSRFYISRCTPMSPSRAEVCSRVIRSTSSADPTRRTTRQRQMTTSVDAARGKLALWPAGNQETLRRRRAVIVSGSGGRDRQSAVGVFVQLVAQSADRNAQDVGGVGPIAQAMLQGLQNEIALHVGHGASDQSAGYLFGGEGGVRHGWYGFGCVEPLAIRRQNGVDADLVTLRHQNRTVDGVFEFADVALPPAGGQRAPCIRRDRPQRHAVGLGVFLGEMLGEFEDIRRAFAKRRYLQVDHVEPEQQVLTEAAFANGIGEVAV